MSRYRKLTTICAAVVLSLGLAACGGGGSSPTTSGDDTKKPSSVSLAGLTNHGLTAQTLTIKAGETATVGNVTFSCPSGGADCAVAITVADGTASVTSDGGMATAAYSAAYNKQVADAGKDARSRAQGLLTALGEASGGTGIAGSFNSTSTSENATLAVTAIHDGSKVTTTLGALTNVTAGTGNFTKDTDGPLSISGWHGSNWTRGTQHITVYTDIEAPTAKAMSVANVRQALVNTEATYNTDTRTIGGLGVTAYYSGAASSSFPGAAATKDDTNNRSYTGTDREFEGTLAGASGKFNCTGTTCSVTSNNKGAIQFTAGTWTFVHDKDEKINVPDQHYLSFGYWMLKPASATGEYEFASFYGSNGTAAETHDDLTGTATYKGSAAGVYATQDTSAGQVTGASQGRFTADASLTAAFGTDTENGTIGGSITNFKDQDGGALAGWSLTLNGASLGNDSALAFGQSTTGTIGGSTVLSGRWRGNFFEDTGQPGDATAKPKSVAGQFDAASGSGFWMHGAFGASR